MLRERTHLRERRAEDDEVGVGNGGEQIGRGIIHRAGFFAILQAGGAADVAGDFARQLSLPDGQPDGAAEQADADDGDFLELHARRIAEGRRRMKDGNAVQGASGHRSATGLKASRRNVRDSVGLIRSRDLLAGRVAAAGLRHSRAPPEGRSFELWAEQGVLPQSSVTTWLPFADSKQASNTFCVCSDQRGHSSFSLPLKIWFAKLRHMRASCAVA